MAKKHKDRKAIEKRRAQSRQKRIRHKEKAKARARAREDRHRWTEPDQFITRPPLADIEAPEGFRPVAMAQAMLEYAKPLRDLAGEENVQDLNEILQISMGLWNLGISSAGASGQLVEDQLIQQMQKVLKLDSQEASDLFESMVERKDYLFPPNIQPANPMFMFMRKETSHLIASFNYDELALEEESVGPDEEDEKLIDAIEQMDRYVTDGTDYGEWEDFFFSMRERCADRFRLWLQQKGVEAYSEDFSNCLGVFLDFVYCYAHPDIVTLQNISAPYWEEFFADNLLRKVTVEPYEYIYWPPALKLFFTFLQEKGYMGNPQAAEQLLNQFEPRFVDLLRKRYS